MRIGIITHHKVYNHGASLQLYALEKVLNEYGNVKALDYCKNLDFLGEEANVKYNISIKSIPFYIKYCLEKGIGNTLFNIRKRKTLDRFHKNNDMNGGYYSKERGLDVVFVGSDEVFSIEAGLNPFFWGMGVPCEKIYSYGASFGPTTLQLIKKHNATEFVKGGLNTLNSISVRDENSKEIVYDLTGKNVPIVCDPVILYGFEKEKMNFVRPISDKYIIVYAYNSNMNSVDEVRQIKQFAIEHRCKLISVGFYHSWCDKSINVDPLEALKYIKFAEVVITDTFHGTVMSLVMNTEFITRVRESNKNKLRYLLGEYDLLERETINFDDLNKIYNHAIDFKKVNDIMRKKQDFSMEYLRGCLK